MSVYSTLQTDLITALKSKAEVRVSTLRGLKAAIQKQSIDSKSSPDDDQRAFVALKQEAKKHEDSIAAYSSAGRQDLVAQEVAELEIIKQYLPAAMTEAEVQAVVKQVMAAQFGDIGSTNADKNFGAVMKAVIAACEGRADGKLVSALVKTALSAWHSI